MTRKMGRIFLNGGCALFWFKAMASKELVKTVTEYDLWMSSHAVEEAPVKAYCEAVKSAFYIDRDIEFALKTSRKCKYYIERLIRRATNGMTFKMLEEWSQEHKQPIELINLYYGILRMEAKYLVDSYKLYIEKNRPRQERFYAPRRNTLIKVSNAIQRIENDELDILFLHMPPRCGKLLADDTHVFTSEGWKTHGELAEGDLVIGSDGEFTEVVKVHPKDYADHKVRIMNGETYVCHSLHEWKVFDSFKGEWVIYETKDLKKRFYELSCLNQFSEKKYFLSLPQIPSKQIGMEWASIVSIEECAPKQGNCITVSNEDGLYAVGESMFLTHNSGDLTMDVSWHCARDTEKSNLYVTYKEGLGGAFLTGVEEIYRDPTYCFKDVFPDVEIKATDAKNNKIDLGRVKKYKTLSGKGLESGLNGEYDAKGWLIIDDPLEGVQDVMSEEVLKRKQIIFDNNVMSRKKEKCKVILMGTIWSVRDLFMNYLEYLQQYGKGTRYEIIKIPALDPKTDESNFNYDYGVGFSTEHYRNIRAKHEMNEDLAGWWAQYQQEPIERDGQVFNPEHMEYYSTLPEGEPLKIIAHGDTALGGGDYVSFPIIYCYEDGSMYCEDVVFDNSEKHITEPQVVAAIKRHNILNAHFETNQGGGGYADDVKRLLTEDKSYNGGKPINITTDWAPVTKRKQQRIWDRAEAIRQIKFKDPQHRHTQYQKFMRNLFSFTLNARKRAHEDAADSLAGAIDFDIKGSGVATVQAVENPFRRR